MSSFSGLVKSEWLRAGLMVYKPQGMEGWELRGGGGMRSKSWGELGVSVSSSSTQVSAPLLEATLGS